ncbi:MAG TPA: hypothetical protein PLZ43_13790 [bacterium]|nr:hypothetical protein [bacterium]
MSNVAAVNPNNYFVILDGKSVAGVKSMNMSFPNDDCSIEVDMYGNPSFIENPAGKICEITLDCASEQKGNGFLQVFANNKVLTAVTVMNALTNKPVIHSNAARVMITGWGRDDSGSDIPTNWKILTTASKTNHL